MRQPMMRHPLHAGLDAIARMSATRTNYWAEFGIDIALGLVLLGIGWHRYRGGPLTALAAIGLGLFAFSFVEYFFHRWMFHTRIPLFERGHRMHHEHPCGYDSLPFFLPAAVLLCLTGTGMLVMPAGFTLLMAGAVTLGYVGYGLCHFAIHHVRFRQPLLMHWAANHHIHHRHPDSNFGVTTPLWDVLLGTRYVRQARKQT